MSDQGVKKSTRLRPDEYNFIQDNCLSMSDDDIARKLNRPKGVIANARKKFGVKKQRGGQGLKSVLTGTSIADERIVAKTNQKLTEKQREIFFRDELCNSLYYSNLQKQFTPDELNFYLNEWGGLCLQFEDVLATEKRQIDEYIKAEILGNRILRNIKITEEEIEFLQEEVVRLRKDKNMEEDEVAQERDDKLINMIRSFSGQCGAMSIDYQKNVQLRNEILMQLNARRKDRIENIKKSGTTFLGLVAALREKEIRDVQGRQMELIRLSKVHKAQQFREPVIFPDGSIDSIVLDDNSAVHQVAEKDNPKNLIEKYRTEEARRRVLLVENDDFRIQFFQTVFKQHEIKYASNTEKAIEILALDKDFHLICLDYDLGLDTKGVEVARFLRENQIFSEILIHSNNPVGRQKMYGILYDRKVQCVSFDKIWEEYNGKASNGPGIVQPNQSDGNKE